MYVSCFCYNTILYRKRCSHLTAPELSSEIAVITIEDKVYSTATLADDFDDNHVLVVISNAASLAKLEYKCEDFDEINCKSIKNLTQTATNRISAKLSGTKETSQRSISSEYVTLSNVYNVNTEEFHQVLSIELAEPGKENVLVAIEKLIQRTDVLYAGPNYIYQIDQPEDSRSLYRIDPWDAIDAQWAIDAIQLRDAWDLATGGTSRVAVGIIDNGVDLTHPELVQAEGSRASWVIDLDGERQQVTYATDSSGHGTKIAGIIGARTFNGGIAGINYNVEIVSLDIYADGAQTSLSAMLEAIEIAQEQDIPILNVSVGPLWDNGATALLYAVRQYPGLIVCAAGNDGQNLDAVLDTYPLCLDSNNIIVVGASNTDDDPCVDSNYHPDDVDLFAPGADILSCHPMALCSSNNCTSNHHYDYGYHYGSGTSFAAPYVAGVASLLLSMYQDQVMSYSAVRYHIINGVDVCDSMIGKCATDGRLNAYKVLSSHIMNAYHEPYDNAYHQSFCWCTGWKLEWHTWIDIGGMQYCSACGYLAS
ncbi:MAG: hypothetical protein E7448_04600 [Ruminococcaceae bacterium]|nr:hypothetical protein [Oscillospiraceae bacterium]